mmetsp:Transcript_28047/g.47161  ORF Transcript_28047/g.47161 Transcript_28047/m.47161 type:complete len:545 (+) Transcript_28047:141-1775(+)
MTLSDSNRAYYSDLYQKWSSRLYWINFAIAMVYAFIFVIGLEILGGGYKKEYVNGDTSVSRPGFFVHALSGVVFYVSGYLQFNKDIRRNYPGFHRACGILYLSMSALLFLGVIVVICSGAISTVSSAFWVATMLPYWIFLMYDSMTSIWRRDVNRHRRMMLRSFILANLIIWQRPITFALWLGAGVSISLALAVAFWFATVWAVAVGEVYLYLDWYLRPAPVVFLEDGSKFFATDDNLPALGGDPLPIVVDEFILSPDKKSVQLLFHVADASSTAGMSFYFPGQQVSLQDPTNFGSVREYSPIVTEKDAKAGRVRLWIRLVPGGVMGSILKNYGESLQQKQQTGGKSTTAANPMLSSLAEAERGVSGNKATAEAGISPTPLPLLFSVASDRFPYFPNNYESLLLVCTGTGLAPLYTLCRYVLLNRNDSTKVYLLYITNGAEPASDYGLHLLDELRAIEDSRDSATRGLLTIEKRPTKPRFDVVALEELVKEKRAAEVLGFGRRGVQLHIAGNPGFVKTLHLAALRSPKLAFANEQSVAWGFTDR